MSNSSLPTIQIIDIQKHADRIQTTIKIINEKNYFYEPIAPAWISKGGQPNGYRFEFHKLINFKRNALIFETYRLDSELPIIGEQYQFCSIFIPSQIELIQDTTKTMAKEKVQKIFMQLRPFAMGEY